MVAYPDSMLRNTESNTQPGCPAGAEISALSCFPCCKELFRQVAAQLFRPWIHNSMHCQHFPSALGPFLGMVQKQVITLAPKKLIRTRRASEGSASEPALSTYKNGRFSEGFSISQSWLCHSVVRRPRFFSKSPCFWRFPMLKGTVHLQSPRWRVGSVCAKECETFLPG